MNDGYYGTESGDDDKCASTNPSTSGAKDKSAPKTIVNWFQTSVTLPDQENLCQAQLDQSPSNNVGRGRSPGNKSKITGERDPKELPGPRE
ncbi:MAG: hypothetical protein Q9185_003990 [Variospora sp. 1 TL-2023]